MARFAVIGCGSIGKRHLRNLLALGERDLLAFDPRADRRAEAEALGTRAVGELDALWDAGPDAILVTTPTKLHVPIALEGAERGCHLFLEKPVSDVHDDALERLLKLVRARDLVTLVGCNLRFHPGLLRAKAILDGARLGRVVSIRAEFGQYLADWHPWEDYRDGYSARKDLGGGVVLDAIHELDYVRWLMGEVSLVTGFVAKLSHLEIDTEDTANILLRFASGVLGEIHLDYVQRTYTRACTVIGDEGTLAWAFGDAGRIRLFSAATKAWEDIPGPAGWEVNQMYLDEMKHFVACVGGTASPLQDVFEATRVLDIALAAKTSSGGHALVRLDDTSRSTGA